MASAPRWTAGGPPLRREVGYGAVLVVGLPTQGSDLAMQAPGHLGVCFRLAGLLVVRTLRTRACVRSVGWWLWGDSPSLALWILALCRSWSGARGKTAGG